MADLEVRELRYFRAVARERSLSGAAALLGMAQPPLSRAISRLERRLGVRLFERDNRGVTLTPAGDTLLAEAERVLDAVSAAAHRTRRAALDTPTLVATAKPGIASALLTRIVEAYRSQPAAASVEILVSGYGEQAGLIRSGRVDLALVGSPRTDPDLDAEPLVTEPRVAALPAAHPLTARPALSVADLAGEPMPLWQNATPDELDYWAGRDRVPSSLPVTGPSIQDSSQLVEVVALGQAVALVPSSLAARNQRQDVVYRPVHDASPYVIAIAWAAGARSRWLAGFVRVATSFGSLEHIA
ncbi:MAG: LysR family transcriptional regulator [Actinophytocola sp.]|uniref:LysR family transcriptional regulator n=1 Tax=Actinophytocola sp. TaxID=1872138 RepID=UPI0013247290|nr:LysR family transcriptional regulator [Actinophytocola sp.]MPZ85206.1 LysR family transcriptional regulator [Actinophytocola sp.]